MFISDWLLKIAGPHFDLTQFGSLAANSISHYLIHLIDFILSNQDSKEATAVLANILDLSKAFNRISHCKLIIIMHEHGIPGWLLK